jgi:hypothetical protein
VEVSIGRGLFPLMSRSDHFADIGSSDGVDMEVYILRLLGGIRKLTAELLMNPQDSTPGEEACEVDVRPH